MNHPTLSDVVSCLSGYDPDALPVAHAQQIIRDFVTPVQAVEKVALRSALDRVLASDIISPINVPAHDNSAMDGYALRRRRPGCRRADHACASSARPMPAAPIDGAPAAGECVRIMTGGVMPAGCDTVVPQEFVTSQADTRSITIAARRGAHRRQPPLGRRRPEGRAAGAGSGQGASARPTWACWRRSAWPKCRCSAACAWPSFPPATSCARSASRWTKAASTTATATRCTACCTRLGCDIIDMGVVRDDPAALEAALRSACENADAIITSGGVSVGAADYTQADHGAAGRRDVLEDRHAPGPARWRSARIASDGHSAFLFGLPGNPVAVMVSFYFFAREALLRMMGAQTRRCRC